MTTLNFNTTSTIKAQSSCKATFLAIYGIGKIKAQRINAFLLNHPQQTKFHRDLESIMNDNIGRSLVSRVPIDAKIRLFTSHALRDKMEVFCYQAYRIFQNLPTKGQRTKCNGGTPARRNPYLSLRVNTAIYPELEIKAKQYELFHNERFDELKAFNKSLEDKAKMRKADIKAKTKASKQSFIKNQKLTK